MSHRVESLASRPARRITVAATIVFLLVITKGQPWNLFERGAFSADFYDAQARAFLHGHLTVAPDVAGIEGFLIHGRTYLYYGPFLALLRLPTALFGHVFTGRLSAASLTVAFFLACAASYHVAEEVGRVLQRGSTRRSTIVVAAVACSPALGLAGWNSVYDETELWAFALALITIALLLRLWSAPTLQRGLLAAAAATCTLLTRSSVGLGMIVAVVGVALLLRRPTRVVLGTVGAAACGAMIGVAINLAKFGSMFGLPADRQVLTLRDPTRAAWFAGNGGSFFGTRFLPTTLVQYLRPDALRFERLLPVIRFGPLAHEFGSYPLQGNTPASSLPAAASLLFAFAVAGCACLVVAVVRRSPSWPLLTILAGTAIAAAPSLLIGFVAYRYLTDMLPMLVVVGAVAAATLARPQRLASRTVTVLVAVAAVWGTWVNVSLALWIQDLKDPGFTSMRYAIDDAVFGGVPPSVIRLAQGQPAPRDGVVAIDGGCDGLYIAEQGAWVPLEQADGVRSFRASVALADLPVTMHAPQGDLTVALDNAAVVVTFTPSGAPAASGGSVPVAGPRATLDVISDPVLGQLNVAVDGHPAFFGFAAPDFSVAESDPAISFVTRSGSTSVCERLLRRMPVSDS